MRILRHCIIFLSVFLSALFAYSQNGLARPDLMEINNFMVEENLLKNSKLAVIATDANEKPLEYINGTFIFSVNGFRQELKFNNGIAVAPQPIDKSTFLYLRHENDMGTHGKLFFIYKKDNNLRPVKISWMILVLVPAVIIVLAMLFRKFILIAGILLIIALIFNSRNGLNISTFFATIVDGLKNLF